MPKKGEEPGLGSLPPLCLLSLHPCSDSLGVTVVTGGGEPTHMELRLVMTAVSHWEMNFNNVSGITNGCPLWVVWEGVLKAISQPMVVIGGWVLQEGEQQCESCKMGYGKRREREHCDERCGWA